MTRTRHGHSLRIGQSKTYRAWAGMKSRANGSKNPEYYKDRGIGICERWQSFDYFLADMGVSPAGSTLERIDNAKGYEPGNCVWATRADQSRNRRSTKLTSAIVRVIRTSTENRNVLAARYGVTAGLIDRVRAKTIWKGI